MNNSVFLSCSFWLIWAEFVFGLFLWVSLVGLRYWRLFTIVSLWNDGGKWRIMLIGFAVLWVPVLVEGIVFSVFQVDGPTYEGQIFQCELANPAEYALLATLVIYLLIGIVRSSVLSPLWKAH